MRPGLFSPGRPATGECQGRSHSEASMRPGLFSPGRPGCGSSTPTPTPRRFNEARAVQPGETTVHESCLLSFSCFNEARAVQPGETSWVSWPRWSARSFNEARAVQPGETPSPPSSAARCWRFNEARAVQPGETRHRLQQRCMGAVASMRPGLFSPGRRCSSGVLSPNVGASMRPGLFSPGRPRRLSWRRLSPSFASMRPGLFSPGRRRLPRSTPPIGGAPLQ